MFIPSGSDPRPTVSACQRILGKIVHSMVWGTPQEMVFLVEQLEGQVRILRAILLPEQQQSGKKGQAS